MTIKEAIENLKKHDKMVEDFYDDPMTKAIGAPTRDFQSDFDAKERKLLAIIIENAPDGSEEHEMALGRLDKWMP
jgi:hypothetical protein